MTEHPESPYEPEELVGQDGVGVPDPFMRLWTPHGLHPARLQHPTIAWGTGQ